MLADRVLQGALPGKQMLDLGRRSASALEVADAKGIIHRDLKPASIKVTQEGSVKVLDFGMAKAWFADVRWGVFVSIRDLNQTVLEGRSSLEARSLKERRQ